MFRDLLCFPPSPPTSSVHISLTTEYLITMYLRSENVCSESLTSVKLTSVKLRSERVGDNEFSLYQSNVLRFLLQFFRYLFSVHLGAWH